MLFQGFLDQRRRFMIDQVDQTCHQTTYLTCFFGLKPSGTISLTKGEKLTGIVLCRIHSNGRFVGFKATYRLKMYDQGVS